MSKRNVKIIFLLAEDNRGSVFGKFHRNSPARSAPTAQVLFDYEENYMRLVKNYRWEIEFINDMHTTHTREVKNFYGSDLPAIIKKLETEPIADDLRHELHKHLEQHMSKSFDMSGHLSTSLRQKRSKNSTRLFAKKSRHSD